MDIRETWDRGDDPEVKPIRVTCCSDLRQYKVLGGSS